MESNATHDTVLDTAALPLGRVYARALLDAAAGSGSEDQVVAELAEIVDGVLANNSNLAAVFASPRIDQSEKVRIIDRLFGDKVSAILLRFLKVASSRGRLGYLREIRSAAEQLRNEAQGRVVAHVTTATALTSELRKDVTSKLSTALGKEILLQESVDESLIGGLVVRVGDTVIDTSVAGKLDTLAGKAKDGFARRLMAGTDAFISP